MKKSYLLCALCLVGGLFLSACKPGEEPTKPTGKEKDLFGDGGSNTGEQSEGSKKPRSKTSGVTESPSITASTDQAPVEPDWQSLKMALVKEYAKTFTPPTPGEEFVLVMRDGSKKPATLEKVEGSMVHVELAAGNVGYPATALHPSSQVALFEQAHAQYETVKELRKRRTDYEKSKAEWDQKQQQLQAQSTHPKTVSVRPASVPVNDPSKNGAVIEVVDYLRDYVRNPETVRFRKWGKVQTTDSGWRVSLEYSFSTETMKDAVTHKWFLMDKNGKVYRTALFKDPGSLPK